MDEAAEREPRGMAGQLAVMTAILATFGATFSYMAGATQADTGLFKNDAAIKKTEASNQWNFYQSKSGKQNLTALVPQQRISKLMVQFSKWRSESVGQKSSKKRLE